MYRKWIVLACLAVVAGLAASPARAEKTHRVPGDFETIGEAVAAAQFGDTILVGPGVWKECLVLTDAKGDGLAIKSTDGRAKTTLAYCEEGNVNEAVVTFQRCSNSTQLIGFTIDGRGAARRGLLANSDSRPVLMDIQVDGCEYGIAAHRGSRPYLRDVVAQNASTAGLFISGGSADVKGARFTKCEKFGIYVGSSSDPLELRDVRVVENGQVGVQSTDGQFTFTGGEVSNNGDTGLILQDSSPTLSGVTVSGHSNLGIVMEASSARIVGCRIADNEFGAVSSIDGSPTIIKCTFENNRAYHLGIEGEARPIVGGSLENANRFLGKPEFRVQHTSVADVDAKHNFWDLPCAPKKFFQISGAGKLIRRPWASGNLRRSFDDCTESRKYNRMWKEGKLDDQGNPLARAGGTASDEG